jgi:hypothetical protein
VQTVEILAFVWSQRVAAITLRAIFPFSS